MPEFQFQSLSEFFAMGGDAFYIWTAYGFFAVVIVLNLFQPVLARRRIERDLKARWQREATRQGHASQEAGE